MEEERLTSVTVKLIKSQADLLDELSDLTQQSKTTLIREALAGYLVPLYKRVKELAAAGDKS